MATELVKKLAFDWCKQHGLIATVNITDKYDVLIQRIAADLISNLPLLANMNEDVLLNGCLEGYQQYFSEIP